MKDIRSIKFAILQAINSSTKSKVHKYNLIGRGSTRGDLELFLKIDFDLSDRVLADQAFEDLKKDKLIVPTYDDIIEPANWVKLTEKGQTALKTKAIDDLDLILVRIDENLLEIREGAWSALDSVDPDTLRQSAHSSRELVDQVLKIGAPDSEIRNQNWYIPDDSSRSGITRRHRIKFLIKKYKGDLSNSDLEIVEKWIDLLYAIQSKLQSMAHSRDIIKYEDVKNAIENAEKVLKIILI